MAQSVGETCIAVRDSVGKRRMQLQERIEILQTFVSFCSLSQEVSIRVAVVVCVVIKEGNPLSSLAFLNPTHSSLFI